jgi:hypothetical protein
MAVNRDIQYVSDESGRAVGVLVPIDLWREIASERETAYLLQSETMKKRLLEAKDGTSGIPLEEAKGTAWNLTPPHSRIWPGGWSVIGSRH